MQNLLKRVAIGVMGTIAGPLFGLQSVDAFTFDQQEVSQEKFIAIAVPLAQGDLHNLLVLEQISSAKKCWQEDTNQPGVVDPLLLNFDFTGICGRSTDSNGYSIRVAGQDLGIDYRLSVRKRGSALALVGYSAKDARAPELIIGRTTQSGSGFLKIELEPGWRFAKRAYDGKTLGHIYLTRDSFPAVADPIALENSPKADPKEAISQRVGALPEERTSKRKQNKSKVVASQSADANAAKISGANPSKTTAPPSRSAFTKPISIPVPTPGISTPIQAATVPKAKSIAIAPPPASSRTANTPFTTPIQIPVPEPNQAPSQSLPPARQYQRPASGPSDLPSLAAGVLPVPGGDIPLGNAPGREGVYQGFSSNEVPEDGSPPAPPMQLASVASAPSPALSSHRYRVVVTASGAQQNELRTLVPDAFRSNYRGQSVLQVGAYRSQQEADEMLNFLSQNGISGVLDER
ncbi:MAG: DUF3747 domain-containing protein [Thermosynechococcaceae cyanobacterium]